MIGYSAACSVSSEQKPVVSETNTQTQEVKRGTAIGDIAPDFDLAKFDGGNIAFKELARQSCRSCLLDCLVSCL